MKTYCISIILFVLLASACSTAQTPTAASPTNVSPVAVQVPMEFATADLDRGGPEQPAGRYLTPAWFDVPLEFETAKPYRGGGQSLERGQILALERGQNSLGNATHRLVFFAFPSGVSGTETTFKLRNSMPLLVSSETRDISIFRVAGTQWEAVAQPNPAQKGERGVADGTIPILALYELMGQNDVWHTATSEARLRFIVAEPPGRTLLVYVEAPAEDFEAWTSEIEQLLTTVTLVEIPEAALASTEVAPSEAPPGEIWAERGGTLAIDAQDNVYVLRSDAMIYKYDATGKLLAQWGGPGSGEGQFRLRDGSYLGMNLAVDAQGNVFVADIGNDRIQKFDSNGKFLKQWGSEGKEPGQFVRGWAVAVDSKGNVYVGEEGSQRVQKFDNEGNFLAQWGTFGPEDNQFYSIYSVDVDHVDKVYVGDYFQQEVKKFDSDGNLLTAWSSCGPGESGETIRPIVFAFDASYTCWMVMACASASTTRTVIFYELGAGKARELASSISTRMTISLSIPRAISTLPKAQAGVTQAAPITASKNSI